MGLSCSELDRMKAALERRIAEVSTSGSIADLERLLEEYQRVHERSSRLRWARWYRKVLRLSRGQPSSASGALARHWLAEGIRS